MIDPRLTEFSEKQLRVMLRVAQAEQKDLQEHVKSLVQWNLDEIHSDTIAEVNEQIEVLELWATQLSWAIVRVKERDKVTLN